MSSYKETVGTLTQRGQLRTIAVTHALVGQPAQLHAPIFWHRALLGESVIVLVVAPQWTTRTRAGVLDTSSEMGKGRLPSVVDNAIYVDGRRTDDPPNLEDTYELLRERKGMAWIRLYRPTRDDIMSLAAEFGLHPLAVDDAIAAHQRPKLERYGALLFTVLRPARYFDEPEKVEFGELHVFPGRTTLSRSGMPSRTVYPEKSAAWKMAGWIPASHDMHTRVRGPPKVRLWCP